MTGLLRITGQQQLKVETMNQARLEWEWI